MWDEIAFSLSRPWGPKLLFGISRPLWAEIDVLYHEKIENFREDAAKNFEKIMKIMIYGELLD